MEIIIWNSLFSTKAQKRHGNIDTATGKMSFFYIICVVFLKIRQHGFPGGNQKIELGYEI